MNWCHHEVDICGFEWNVSNFLKGWFGTDIQVPLTMIRKTNDISSVSMQCRNVFIIFCVWKFLTEVFP